jgi:subtilase family serine protease
VLQGSFSNTKIEVIHDVAVISIVASPTSVTKGELVNITVIVENQGTAAETFGVALYFDYNPPLTTDIVGAPRTVLGLAVNANKTLNFTWNTTNVGARSYTLTAVIPEISGETDKADNILQSSEVTVKAREVQPLPITEIAIGIVVVIAVITLIAILRRRRKKPLLE